MKRGTDQKIVGGQAADPGEYPWMVWILTRRVTDTGLGIYQTLSNKAPKVGRLVVAGPLH